MRQLFLVLLIDEGGQSLVEYALIIGLVSVAAISALHLMGNKTNNTLFNTITCGMSGIP